MSDRKKAVWTDATNTVRWAVTDRAGNRLAEGTGDDFEDADAQADAAMGKALPDDDDDDTGDPDDEGDEDDHQGDELGADDRTTTRLEPDPALGDAGSE